MNLDNFQDYILPFSHLSNNFIINFDLDTIPSRYVSYNSHDSRGVETILGSHSANKLPSSPLHQVHSSVQFLLPVTSSGEIEARNRLRTEPLRRWSISGIDTQCFDPAGQVSRGLRDLPDLGRMLLMSRR